MSHEFECVHAEQGAGDTLKGVFDVGSRTFRALDAYIAGHAEQEARTKAGCACWWKETSCPDGQCETKAHYARK